LCLLLSSYVYLLYYVSIAVFTLDIGLLARSRYSEGPATGHLDTGFSGFPYVYKQMLRWFPRFQVATTCFSCSPSYLNLLVTNHILFTCKKTLPLRDNPIAVNNNNNNYYYYYYSLLPFFLPLSNRIETNCIIFVKKFYFHVFPQWFVSFILNLLSLYLNTFAALRSAQ